MKRHRQRVEELLAELAPVDTSWRDPHADIVLARLDKFPRKGRYTRADLVGLFDFRVDSGVMKPKEHFETSLTIARLFLDLSKDEFHAALRKQLGTRIGITRLKEDPETFFKALETIGLLDQMSGTVNVPATWMDVLRERLKGGRGSAIKGQRRGRQLEDFVERLVTKIFGNEGYDARCQFVGAAGTSAEKADFAIPSKNDPAVLMEAKAYGATGSKQSDVLGDVTRIINEKRSDTHFLLVTDGVTWRDRVNDLRKLVTLQNQGKITRIYTQSMADRLEADLKQLKTEYGL